MRIGEIANVVGLSTSTIRYYEKVGLLTPATRNASGYRDYSERDERRLRLIAQARMLSVPLNEVRQLVGFAVDGRCGPLKTELLSALRKRAADTRRQIRELRSLQRELDRVCSELEDAACDSRDRSADTESCACLDDLTSSAPAGSRSTETDNRKEGRR